MRTAEALITFAKKLSGEPPGPALLHLGRYFLVGPALEDVELPRETDTVDVPEDASQGITALPPEQLVFHPVGKGGRNADPTVLIGRAHFNDIILIDGSVSRSHAALFRRTDGTYGLLDIGSKDGTRVNGQPAPTEGMAPLKLAIGDRIQFGSVGMMILDDKELAKLIGRIKPAALAR